MTNATEDYNTFVRANLPSGMTYSNFRYWVYGKPFVSYKQAKWYLDYTTKMIYLNPSLDLNFLTGTMPSGLTYTRASTATYIGSDGLLKTAAVDVPRFDYDPITLACKGLLIEGSRTNLLLWSNDFANAGWAKVDCTASPGQAGIGGPASATRVIENLASGYHRLEQAVSYTAGQAVTLSAVVRANGNPVVSLTLNSASSFSPNPPRVYFNLDTGSIGVQQNSGVGAIRNLGGGRYRCSITATPSTSGSGVVQIGTHEADGVLTHVGDGVSGAFVECAQLEVGAFASSCILTTTAAVTRAADVCLMTGTNFSRWFNPLEGTIVAEFSTITNGLSNTGGNAFPFVYDFDSAAAPTSGHSLLASAGYGPGVRAQTQSAGVDQAAFNHAITIGTGAVIRHAYAYKDNDFASSLNGGAVSTDTLGTLISPDRLSIGAMDAGGSNQLDGHIRRVRDWPRRLSNARLQELTA